MEKLEEILKTVTTEDLDLIQGLLHCLKLIRAQSNHGSIYINIVDGKLSELDVEHRIRPNISAPWRTKGKQ